MVIVALPCCYSMAGLFVMLHFSFCVFDIGKMIQKTHFFVPKICAYQKKAVPLQRN